MAVNPYTSVSISGYNSSPPPDDGSQTSANKVEWAKHKTKLSDPLKTMIESVNTNAQAACNALALSETFVSTTTATIDETDWGNLYLQRATGNINYPDPSLFENGWAHNVYNAATGIVNLQATATSYFYTTDGALASEVLLYPGYGVRVMNTASIWVVANLAGPTGARAGDVLQTTYAFDTSYVTATELIPYDNTTPVITEGKQVLSLSVTPQKVGNLVEVVGHIWGTAAANTAIVAAMFGGTASNSISAGGGGVFATDGMREINLRYWATSTATSSVTYTIRMGANSGNSYFNGDSGNFKLGGAHMSWIKITEYQT